MNATVITLNSPKNLKKFKLGFKPTSRPAKIPNMPRPRKTASESSDKKRAPVYRVAIGGEIGTAADTYATHEGITLTELVKTALKHYLRHVADPPHWPTKTS
jgi:hypothetical protein